MKRHLRTSLLAFVTLLAAAVLLTACGSSESDSATAAGGAAKTTGGGEKPLKVAIVASGQTNDGAFNAWAADAAERLKADGAEVQIRQGLADPTQAEPVIRQFAARGYDLVIGHGIDVSEPILRVAPQFPDVHFSASGDATLARKLPANVDGWTYDFGQLGYLDGFVAGSLTGVDSVAAVGGPQLPFVLATHKGIRAGLQAANPKAGYAESYTGRFYDLQKEQEAARGLLDKGAQVLIATDDGRGLGQAAVAGGAATIGVSAAAGPEIAKVNITTAKLDLLPTYQSYLEQIRSGSFGRRFDVLALGNRGIVLSPITEVGDLVPGDLQQRVDDLSARLASGELRLPNFFE